MPTLVALDSRLPQSLTNDPNDPKNPMKLNKDIKSIEGQVSADTKYDIRANLREGFSLSPERKLLAICAAIVVALLILIFPQPLPVRIGLGVAVIYGIHYILGKFVKKTV